MFGCRKHATAAAIILFHSCRTCPAVSALHLFPRSFLPALPKPGHRLDLPPLAGSGDALILAATAAHAGRLLVVVTASAVSLGSASI